METEFLPSRRNHPQRFLRSLLACVENHGRPAAAALSDFVVAVLECAQLGLTTNAITLELEYNPYSLETRLTSLDKQYRKQWILAVFMTRALYYSAAQEKQMRDVEVLEEWREENSSLIEIILVIWRGLLSKDQSSMVQFDRSLATKGISGGVASEARPLPPQFVPISQLVLLTLKNLEELEDSS